MTSVTYREFRPTVALAQYVDFYWQLEGSADVDPEPPERILPDGRSELIFNLADPMTRCDGSRSLVARPRSYFVGQTLCAVCVQRHRQTRR